MKIKYGWRLLTLLGVVVLACAGPSAPSVPDVDVSDVGEEPGDATAIVTYARDVLGIEVSPLYAGGLTGDVSRMLNTSPEGEAAGEAVADVAVVTYGALFPNGAASLSFGDGTVSGDVNVDINTASLGAYSFLTGGQLPDNEAEALSAVLATFPALAGRTFTATPTEQGFAWTYQGQTPGFELETFQATLVAEAIRIGLTGEGTVIAYAVVGRGSFAGELQ